MSHPIENAKGSYEKWAAKNNIAELVAMLRPEAAELVEIAYLAGFYKGHLEGMAHSIEVMQR